MYNRVPGMCRQCESVAKEPALVRCEMARVYCADDSGRSMVNYLVLHYCGMGGAKWVSVPVLVAVLILAFYILAETAESYFSPVVRRLVEILGLTPSMGGVTLLALGNGAPDIFASLAAIGGDNSRIGFGAILSAGTFVSAFVVGSVALAAAPFAVQPMPFIRDVSFYLGAVCLLFIIYLKGEIVFWQAVGMVSFYVVFVIVVLCTDKKKEVDSKDATETPKGAASEVDTEVGEASPKGSPKVSDIKDTPDEDVVTVDISFKIGEHEKLGTEAEPFGASVGNCWDSFSSPAKGFMELFNIEEVCSSHSFQQASDVLRSAVVLQHLNWA
jgi:Ca2+/Na+ antiporter